MVRRHAPSNRDRERTSVPDIFDEVSEDLRAERAQKLLKQYGGLLMAAALLVIAGVGAWKGWEWYAAQQRAQVATVFLTALRTAERPDGAERAAALPELGEVTVKGDAGYRALARLRAAALKADAGDLAGALAMWDEVAGDRAADPVLRDVATLMWVMRQIDSGDPAVLEARVGPIAAANSPLRAMATEAQALLALRQGRTEAAREGLTRLSQDVTVPDGVRGRANGILAQIGGNATP
jgi:hypothetical protein